MLELFDPVCEVLEIGDCADEDLELKLFLRGSLCLATLWVGVVVVRVVWVRLERAFVLCGDEVAEGSEGVINFRTACLLDKRVIYFALGLAGSTREGAWSATATLWGWRDGGRVVVVVVVVVVGEGGEGAEAFCYHGGCDGTKGGHGDDKCRGERLRENARVRIQRVPGRPRLAHSKHVCLSISCSPHAHSLISAHAQNTFRRPARSLSGTTIFSYCPSLTTHRDEILNGKTLDRNSNYFARFCFDHGIHLCAVPSR